MDVPIIADNTKAIIIEQARKVSMEEAGIVRSPKQVSD